MASRSQHVSTNNSNPDHHNNTTSTSEIEVGDTPVDGLAVTTSTNLSVSKSERTNQNSSLPQISPSNSVGLTQVPAAPSSYITNANLELTKAGSHIHTDTKSNIQTDHRYKKVVNSNTEAQSQPVTEKQTSKNNSDSHVDSGVVLPKRISQMNESERKLWCLTDSNANDCIEDIVSLVQTLVAEFSLEGKAFQIYSPLIDLVGNALLFAKCCEQNRRKVAEILVECGWVEFLMLQTETLLTQVDLAADGWKNDIIISKTDILLQGLTTLTFIINQSSKETVCKMKNNLAKDLLKLLKHKDLETAASNSLEYQVFTRLIHLLGDLVLAEAFSQVMLNGVQLEVEELMLKYLEGTQSKDVRLLSQSILSHITHDDTTPRFSIEYMSKAQPTDESLSDFIESVQHVVKRLESIDLTVHMSKPWRMTWDFRFMERVVIFSTYEKCSSDVRSRVFQTFVKDGTWFRFISTFHQTLMSSLDHYNLETAGELSAFLIESALNNLLSALLTIHNGTDVCKEQEVQQMTFDLFHSLLIQQLQNPIMMEAVCSKSENRGIYTVLAKIGYSMLAIIYNLTYYFDSCIATLRAKGMMAVARNIRENAQNSELRTMALLVMAYLVDEDSEDGHEEKNLLKMTDSELTFLIKELENSGGSQVKCGYHPYELIDSLIRVAVNDHNKLKVIDQGVLPLLVQFLDADKHPPEYQSAAANALWNLAFTDESCQKIVKETGCVEGLSKLKSSKHEEVRKAVDGALWQIQEKHHRNSKTVTVKKQVMLSYHHQSAEQVLKMKNILTSHGYKVWIDVDHITDGGSMLDAMSQGIQESYLVLIFISEAYKNSVYCRAEAEFAFEQKKRFLPIEVDANYKLNGWLDILLGAKYRYCLTNPRRCDVEVKAILSKIKHVIGSGSNGVRNKYRLPPPIPEAHSHKDDDDVTLEGYLNPHPPPLPKPPNSHSQKVSSSELPSPSASPGATLSTPSGHQLKCSSWTSQQVADWLDSSNLSQFKESFKEVDGEMLAELVLLSRDHKDMFYSLLNKTSATHIADFLRFSCAAKKLYMQQ